MAKAAYGGHRAAGVQCTACWGDAGGPGQRRRSDVSPGPPERRLPWWPVRRGPGCPRAGHTTGADVEDTARDLPQEPEAQ